MKRNWLRKLRVAMIFTAVAVAASEAAAQTDEIEAAPPPLKTISDTERTRLDREKGVKGRTRRSLELMNARLANAEAALRSEDFDKAFSELGVFHALIDDTLAFLSGAESDSRKVLFNFKRFEIGIRGFTPRLELIRREMPLTHETYVLSLLKQLRDARTKATEPLFGETVLQDNET
ncbi:MAG TPA: hypothetical protein VK918_10175 [Pyrinomonadaceae bacterium]|nr:hypothetical protein [Pyrinomonadaceae bacterium]